MNKERIIGIDLGMESCCLGILSDFGVKIIPDENGNRIIPFEVGFKDKKLMIGVETINIRLSDKIKYPKKLIGRLYNDHEVQKELLFWPIKVIGDNITGKPQYYIVDDEKEYKFFPEDIYTLLLKNLKKNAEVYCKKKILKVIISVPLYFNYNQIKETEKAVEKAGLEVVKIIYEPTAIVVGYFFKTSLDNNKKKILVFNMINTITDVTIVEVEGNKYSILASCHDGHFGGEDFKNQIIDFVLNRFKTIYGFKNINFYDRKNKEAYKAYMKLKRETENISSNSIFYDIESFYKKIDFKYEIFETDIEEICKNLFEVCFQFIKETLNQAKLNKEDIDYIILSGRSFIRIDKQINNFFGNKKIMFKNIIRGEEIAYGCSILSSNYETIIEIPNILEKKIQMLERKIENIEKEKNKIIETKDIEYDILEKKYEILKKEFEQKNKEIKEINRNYINVLNEYKIIKDKLRDEDK